MDPNKVSNPNKASSSKNSPFRESWDIYNKSPIHEKSINFRAKDGVEDAFIAKVIHEYEWDDFAQQPGDFHLESVMEFYQNLKENANYSTVQGKKVSFSPSAINRIYKLPKDINDEKTLEFIENPNMDLVEGKLCPFGANWTCEKNGDKSSVRARNIGRKWKPLLSFVSSRLVPNEHKTEIYKDRLILTYVICSQMPLDIGKFISKQIKYCRFISRQNKVWFPSTVTKLIRNAGVTPVGKETKSEKKITKRIWTRMKPTIGPKPEGETSRIWEPTTRGRRTNSVEVMSEVIKDVKVSVINELTKGINEVKASIKEQGETSMRSVAELIKRHEWADDVKLQYFIYVINMLWKLANYIKKIAQKAGYNSPMDFPPFVFVDPNFVYAQPQPENEPHPTHDRAAPVLTKYTCIPRVFPHGSNVNMESVNPTSSTSTKKRSTHGIVLREPSLDERSAKKPRKTSEKGKEKEEQKSEYLNSDDEMWLDTIWDCLNMDEGFLGADGKDSLI